MKQEQCTPIICASELGCNLLIRSFSSSKALRRVFRPWPPRCRGFQTTLFLWGKGVSPKSSPQPGGPLSLSMSRTSIKSCQAWMALPAVRLPPAQRSSSVVHTSSLRGEKRFPQRGDTNEEDLDFSNWYVYQNLAMSLTKNTFLFHTINDTSQLKKNWGTPSPTENINSIICINAPCILKSIQFTHQQMHYLLNLGRFKIYIKIHTKYRYYMFRSFDHHQGACTEPG
jgi:hypothetical protein